MQLGQGYDPKVVAFPGNAGAPKLDRAAIQALLEGRLRMLQVVCGAMVGSAVMLAGASFVAVRSRAMPPDAGNQVSLTLTITAVVVLLAASRLHATMLARAGRAVRGTLAGGVPAAASAVMDAYGRATVISYVLLEATASLGLVVAVITGNVRYSLVICAVAALSMLARWPRFAVVMGLLRRRTMA